jgi:hypothetical protein
MSHALPTIMEPRVVYTLERATLSDVCTSKGHRRKNGEANITNKGTISSTNEGGVRWSKTASEEGNERVAL